tara:strand:- start:4313 stop:4597 length:285 start_codon:yes stop_codon:yes gene_type:complete
MDSEYNIHYLNDRVKECQLWKLLYDIDDKKITNTRKISNQLFNILHMNECKLDHNIQLHFFNKWKNNIKNIKKINQEKSNILYNLVLDISSKKV